MPIITINGITFAAKRSLEVLRGRVIVDGKDATPEAKEIHIEVQGNLERLQVDACETVQVHGTVGSVKTMSGDVRCADVGGSVQTMSGDVHAGQVAGSVSTMSGDVRHVPR
jgi:hypothetical protein